MACADRWWVLTESSIPDTLGRYGSVRWKILKVRPNAQDDGHGHSWWIFTTAMPDGEPRVTFGGRSRSETVLRFRIARPGDALYRIAWPTCAYFPPTRDDLVKCLEEVAE